ncbi:hypothetical protein P775_06390 [Puniceibacterium antarcticum]|uniref:Glycosyl transferase family 28 C-terminal domain-containing protein n=1 Tax=Puniceibacterium antarcticum TaxID=1206336 RepID=A0A2G8RHN7_9RHOB|nr:UDP-2,4-diacetamido-2,4,6-trideoxy-beta-L-altropyranose hydrolase [Puniceibacterium antarcticum]PIL20993.1 hypothetical protein P775_06390 [Puniceibacterium antarcticum]
MIPHNPVIAFRADASIEIGTGHVMRCLTLARAMQDRGARCHFVCRDLPGHLAERIRSQGIECHLLPSPDVREDDGVTQHSRWLGVSGARDAIESRAVLERLAPGWLVVDHYALDITWEQAARPEAARLLVLDDLADRAHDCDLLLDQNLGRTSGDYDGLVPAQSPRLIGPDFALLRPEFAAQRANSLARRQTPRLRHVLVALGGVDREDVTSRVLDKLAACGLPDDAHITVVLGPTAPARDAVARRAAGMPIRTELRVGVDNMAELMASADLAIGAAGGSTWERCCLGLPALIAVLAENQAPAAKAISDTGAALLFGNGADPVAGFFDALSRAKQPACLATMSALAAKIANGKGADRVAHRMSQEGPS